MVVKSGKWATGRLLIATAIAVAVIVVMPYVYNLLIWEFTMIFSCVVIFFSLRTCISIGRTLIFSQKGCTVKLLWFSKHYTWDELKLKRYQDFGAHLNRKYPYEKGAVFSSRAIYREWCYVLIEPYRYCSWFHPLSFFYVFFVPKGASEKQINRLYKEGYYTVDETEFRAKLKEWGVEMDEV